MPASKTRLAIVAAAIVLLALAGLGLRILRTGSSRVEMSASVSTPQSQPPLPPKANAPRPADERGAAGIAAGASAMASTVPPSFDVVRVEPSGEALVAGRGKPDATVTLIDRDRVVAHAKADAAGNFVILPPTLKPGDYALSLRQEQGDGAQESKQVVIVSVPKTGKDEVVVALSEPGKATTLLSAPLGAPRTVTALSAHTAASAKTAAPSPELAIRSVELENGSGLFASGTAPPGSDVQLYLNDSRVANVVTAALGAWTIKIRKGLAAGRYAVRADAVKPDRRVVARSEVLFDVPAHPSKLRPGNAVPLAPEENAPAPATASMNASATAAEHDREQSGTSHASPAPSADAGQDADLVIDELQTELVVRGANLWRISRTRLGHGTQYTQIYAANATQIRDPKLIYPGQVFVLPRE